jgi:MoaA/NifB/PqqE/SkfB family radical SAM enzyme
MTYPNNITSMHIELTDKCQAACPMCPRNVFGGAERSHIKNVEISLAEFKQWFPREFLMNLTHLYACGNNGDPLLASDCLEIFQYLVENTADTCRLDIHTNGSLRSKEWWQALAKTIGNRGHVIFAVDGFEGEHEIYRRNTNWKKVIENAKIFMAAGGRAKADTIIFKHNENRVHELKQFLLDLGFDEVTLKPTQRFYGLENYPVKDKNGNIEYYIQSPTLPEFNQHVMQPNMVRLVDKTAYQKLLDNSKIEPKCMTGRDLFVNALGKVWPCCFVGSLMTAEHLPTTGADFIIRERLRLSGEDIKNDIGIPSLHGTNIIDVLEKSNWGETLPKHFTTDKKLVCVKSCSTNLKQLVEDSNNEQETIKYW